MAGIEFGIEMHLRDEFGQFMAACDQAATDSVEDAIRAGADISRQLAPVQTGRLRGDIDSEMISSRSGKWGSGLKYAMPQDQGAGPHPITGNPWLRLQSGRVVHKVRHPGNPATRFIERAGDVLMGRINGILERNYPG